MADLQQLTTWLGKLRAARATGLRSVRHGDREMTYRSDDDLAKAIRDLENQIAGETGTRRSRRRLTTTSKGL